MNEDRDYSIGRRYRYIAEQYSKIADLLDPPDSAEPRKPETPKPAADRREKMGRLLAAYGDARAYYVDHSNGGEGEDCAEKFKAVLDFGSVPVAPPETPEPADLGELLNEFRDSVRSVGCRYDDCDSERERLKAARQNIEDFVARLPYDRAAEWTAAQKASLMEYDKLANWLYDRRKDIIREVGEGKTYADIAIRLVEKSGEVAAENERLKVEVNNANCRADGTEEENERLNVEVVLLNEASGGLAADAKRHWADCEALRAELVQEKTLSAAVLVQLERVTRQSEVWRGKAAGWEEKAGRERRETGPAADVAVEHIAEPDKPAERPLDKGRRVVITNAGGSDSVRAMYDAEAERKPGVVRCGLTGEPTTPDSRPCDDRAHRERPARQKTNTHDGWAKGVIQKCEHCPEIHVESGEIPGGVVRCTIPPENTYSVKVYIEQDPEVETFLADVPRLPGCHSYGDTVDEAKANITEALTGCLKSYLADGEIPWLPLENTPPCPPGAIVRVVTVKIEPNDTEEPTAELPPLSEGMRTLVMARVLGSVPRSCQEEAIRELCDAIRRLEANQLDPKATCGECRREDTGDATEWVCRYLNRHITMHHPACMKIQRKPAESEPETKARFFRSLEELWVYPAGDDIGWWFDVSVKEIERSETPLSESEENVDGIVKGLSFDEAIAILTEADWPEGLAELRELIGGNDE